MKKRKPTTNRGWALYRAQLSCRGGRNALEGLGKWENESDMDLVRFAIFNLLHAVEDIAKAMEAKR